MVDPLRSRSRGRPGLIRAALAGVVVLTGGAAITMFQSQEDAGVQAVLLSDAEVMARLVAPPAPGSFAVTEDVAAPLLVADADLPDCVTQLSDFLSGVSISFDQGAAEISTQNVALLTRIGDEIARCDGAYVMVAGHANSSGEDDVNLALSWERADQTLNTLLGLGVDPGAVEAIGFGARAPLAQGSSDEEGRDRRVDFRVMRRP